MFLNVVCSQLNLHFTLIKFYTLRNYRGNVPGKHLEIPGSYSNKNSCHPAKRRIIFPHFQQSRLSTYRNDDDDDDDDDDDELFLWYC